MKSHVGLMFLVLLLSGCGTVNTVFRDEYVVHVNMKEVKTKCSSISRIYSGVSYDLCLLHAEPSSSPLILSAPVPFVLVDIALSGVADTVLLPYGIYKQVDAGNIELNR
ncbi:YceK/YidQ family lipoprotein [Litoribacillus peritrichatus]|uniref:YceK/YidQ family lipoprotein n=1 Tax=Litoribacillus peritrichatus TaxID=718191 RepID=A0ABP7MB31_9GAMM